MGGGKNSKNEMRNSLQRNLCSDIIMETKRLANPFFFRNKPICKRSIKPLLSRGS